MERRGGTRDASPRDRYGDTRRDDWRGSGGGGGYRDERGGGYGRDDRRDYRGGYDRQSSPGGYNRGGGGFDRGSRFDDRRDDRRDDYGRSSYGDRGRFDDGPRYGRGMQAPGPNESVRSPTASPQRAAPTTEAAKPEPEPAKPERELSEKEMLEKKKHDQLEAQRLAVQREKMLEQQDRKVNAVVGAIACSHDTFATCFDYRVPFCS